MGRMVPGKDGCRGLAMALCACGVQSVSLGMMNCIPSLFGSMIADATLTGVSMPVLSLLLGVAGLMHQTSGVVAGQLLRAAGPAALCTSSMVLLFFAFGIAPACCVSTGLAMVFLIGVPGGLGLGMMMTPGSAATASWFHHYGAVAQGVVFTGGGIGSCILTPLAGRWVLEIGWRETMQRLSYFAIGGLIFALPLRLRPHDLPGEVEEVVTLSDDDDDFDFGDDEEMTATLADSTRTIITASGKSIHDHHLCAKELLSVAGSRLFLSFLSSAFFLYMCFYSFLYLAVPYATSMGAKETVYRDATPIAIDSASTLMIFFGAFFAIGSFTTGYFSHRAGSDVLYCSCIAILIASAGLMPLSRSYTFFAVLYSFFGAASAGSFASLSAQLAHAFHGPNLGLLMSGVMAPTGLAAVAGPYIQSILSSPSNQGDFTTGLMLMAVYAMLSGLAVSVAIAENR